MTILTDDSIQISYFYHELEPEEYDEKQTKSYLLSNNKVRNTKRL